MNLNKDTLKSLHQSSTWRSLYYIFKTYFFIISPIALVETLELYYLYPLLILWIGARQHSLYVLNHDCSHGNLFKKRIHNQILSQLFITPFFFHHPELFSFHWWRRQHILHHRFLMTNQDPNYLQRVIDKEDIKMTKTMLYKKIFMAPINAFLNFFIGKQDSITQDLKLIKSNKYHLSFLFHSSQDPEMENERKINLFLYVSFFILIAYFHMWTIVFIYWFIPLYLVLPMVLKYMDLTEHNWWDKSLEISNNSNSSKPNLISTLFISDLNRTLHIEHHLYPQIPFYYLSRIRE